MIEVIKSWDKKSVPYNQLMPSGKKYYTFDITIYSHGEIELGKVPFFTLSGNVSEIYYVKISGTSLDLSNAEELFRIAENKHLEEANKRLNEALKRFDDWL